MSAKSTPLSFRVSDEDAEFLAGLSLPGAVTPSEKLRGLVTRARLEHAGTRSYQSSLERIRELLDATEQAQREHERQSRQRSTLVAELLAWAPDLVAFLMAGPPAGEPNDPAWRSFEAGLAERVFRLVEAVLRLGVTTKAPCYNPELIAQNLAGTLELSQLIVANRSPSRGSTP
ncbi:MAG: hypothetical protein AB7V26_10495 [Lysobacterales bacterium]